MKNFFYRQWFNVDNDDDDNGRKFVYLCERGVCVCVCSCFGEWLQKLREKNYKR